MVHPHPTFLILPRKGGKDNFKKSNSYFLGALANGETHTNLQPPGFPTIAYPGIGEAQIHTFLFSLASF
jgi:hypothetical protein